MDRASFLRALPYLRPLHQDFWASSCSNTNNEASSSCSTSSSPDGKNESSANKNHKSKVLFDESFVVSIEPNIILNSVAAFSRAPTINDNGDKEEAHSPKRATSRKRGRQEISSSPHSSDHRTLLKGPPAFFQTQSTFPETSETRADKKAQCQSKSADATENGGKEANEIRLKINNDPALCSFEAAIVSISSTSLSVEGETSRYEELEEKSKFTTPEKSARPVTEEMNTNERKVLIFRFGHHFVFHVDDSAINEIRYENGSASENLLLDQGTNTNQIGSGLNAPPLKRQREESSRKLRAEEQENGAKTNQLPPSLLICFTSCTFRVFSLDRSGDESKTAPSLSPHVWGTLANTVEKRIKNAKSLLEGILADQPLSSSWVMAAPGTGAAMMVWPDSFEKHNFHLPLLESWETKIAEKYAEGERWCSCLGQEHKELEDISTLKGDSSAKTDSSSTHFENGQNDNSISDGIRGGYKKTGSRIENNKILGVHAHDPDHSSGSSREQNTEDSNDSSTRDDSVLMDDDQRKTSNTKPLTRENPKLDNKFINNQPNGDHSMDNKGPKEIEKDDKLSWMADLSLKRQLFDTSWDAIQQLMTRHASVVSSQRKGLNHSSNLEENERNELLTACADTLSMSYISTNEFVTAAKRCETEIGTITNEIDKTIESMFPARGKVGGSRGGRLAQASASSSRAGTEKEVSSADDNRKRIEELMHRHQQAVMAKYSLLMIPKR